MLFTDNTTSGAASAEVSQAGAAGAKLEDDLNQFLTLLTTQLQNQDPLDPMDANEFTSQLVQFASVEQQIYQNANLEQMLNLQQSGQVADMVSYLGTSIEATGRSFNLEDGTAEYTYTTPAGAKSGSIVITNSSGLTVYTGEPDLDSGKHNVVWNGLDKNGQQAPDGTYNVLVTILDGQDDLMSVDHTVFGRVTGASAEEGDLSLYTGDLPIRFEDIISVREPKAQEVVN